MRLAFLSLLQDTDTRYHKLIFAVIAWSNMVLLLGRNTQNKIIERNLTVYNPSHGLAYMANAVGTRILSRVQKINPYPSPPHPCNIQHSYPKISTKYRGNLLYPVFLNPDSWNFNIPLNIIKTPQPTTNFDAEDKRVPSLQQMKNLTN